MENPLKYFAELTDPRVERNREHLLEEILLMAIAAVLSGAESWNDIEEYGQSKREWLKTFLTLPSGIPSHDTFNRVFAALDPEEMEKGFVAWVGSIAKLTAGEVVAIDGKALRGSYAGGKKPIVHMVSAWAERNSLVLAQRKVDEKSNEITAIPKLLEALELSGTVVTIDAMGCQRAIARQIMEKRADYVLAAKENQGQLYEQIQDSFRMLPAAAVAEEVDCGQGRVERRRCSVIADLSLVEKAAEWASLQGLVRMQAERYHKATGHSERHQPRARCGALEPRDPATLGHRKQIALGARCRLRRRPQPQTARPRGAELLPPHSHRPQPAETGPILKTRDQREAPQGGVESLLSTQIAGNLICVGPDYRPAILRALRESLPLSDSRRVAVGPPTSARGPRVVTGKREQKRGESLFPNSD
jgi:hypothetical protein